MIFVVDSTSGHGDGADDGADDDADDDAVTVVFSFVCDVATSRIEPKLKLFKSALK